MIELFGIGGIVGIAIVVSLVFLVMLVASRYKTVSPDEAMIITGAALGQYSRKYRLAIFEPYEKQNIVNPIV